MRIDIHAHYWPQDYLDLMKSMGRTDLPPRGQPADFAPRIAELDAAGIDVQILSAIGMNTQMPSRETALPAAQFINDLYAGVCRENTRFRFFGWLPLPYVEDALTEAARCLDDLDAAGIVVACAFQERPLDDPEFEPLWAELNRRKTSVFVHPSGSHSCGHWGLDKYNMDIMLGSPLQLTIAAQRLVYSGLTQRYPDIRFAFATCGGHLPYLYPRIQQVLETGFKAPMFYGWVKETGLSKDDPMAEFRKFYYDTSTEDLPLAMLAVKQSIGTDRIVLGSDATFGVPSEVVTYIQDNPHLTEAEKDSILNHNATRFLGLSTAPMR